MADNLYTFSRQEAKSLGRLAELRGPAQEQADSPAQGGMGMG